eukprot:2521221-Prymnesium_polylepis.2
MLRVRGGAVRNADSFELRRRAPQKQGCIGERRSHPAPAGRPLRCVAGDARRHRPRAGEAPRS